MVYLLKFSFAEAQLFYYLWNFSGNVRIIQVSVRSVWQIPVNIVTILYIKMGWPKDYKQAWIPRKLAEVFCFTVACFSSLYSYFRSSLDSHYNKNIIFEQMSDAFQSFLG